MRMGIRGKLVGTLMLAGLLPLALSLGTGLLAAHQARRQFIGQSFRAMARQHAEHLSTLLSAQIDFFWVISQLPGTREFLTEASRIPELTQEQIEQIESIWQELPDEDPPLNAILSNDIARRWQAIQRLHPRISEAMITDRQGRLVAATNKTSDYFQADEQWWQDCWADGRGRILVADVSFDESAIAASGARGTLVVNICLPIYPAEERQPIGIMKVSLDAGWLLGELGDTSEMTDPERVWLVNRDGRPITGVDEPAPFDRIPEELFEEIRAQPGGYVISRDMPEHEVMGFARISFPGRKGERPLSAPANWYVIVTAERREALAPTRPLIWAIMVVGVAFIGLCFVAGLWIAQREVIRPLFMLGRGARELERGRLEFRMTPPGERGSVFRDDEIGQLARDFNRMAEELGRHVAELARANSIKQQFIDLASHELRTPVTYILGVTELAQRQRSAEAPLLGRIGVKAQRLNRIVENMFKLLQSGSFDPLLNLEPVALERVVSSTLQEVEPFLQLRKQRVEVSMPAGMQTILADSEKLRDILNNLLTNAIRFSPDEGRIGLEVVDRRDRVEIVVSDSGPGIAAEDLPQIFEPFFTGARTLPHHKSGEFEHMTRGIGLGLSVVKRFAEMHDGTVEAASSPEGARFRLTLPKGGPAAGVGGYLLAH